ncbi:MAG: UDP-N-acetylmuramoyl-L-alanine--D-glutamate ligase [Bacteroidota bacterium]
MDDLIRKRFSGKSVAILGFGREGQSTYSLIRRVLPDLPLTIVDANENVVANPLVARDNNLQFITGDGYESHLPEFDLIVRSPGITIWQLTGLPGQPVADGQISHGKITSQTELFLEKYSAQVIGITGTKGKSTTSSLIHHILRCAGRDVLLAGNIGNPVFHITGLITPETLIVVELSSHQLEFLKVAPHISVFLNLFQEHLDAYPSYEAYQHAKLNITRYQSESDFIVFNADDNLVSALINPFLPFRKGFSYSLSVKQEKGTSLRDGQIVFCDGLKEVPVWKIHQDRFLRGEHNLKNIMAAINVAMILGIDPEFIEEGIATFKGLEHRLEYVGEYKKIHFYNDSIATIPEACIEAIRAIPSVDTLVAGGFDRGIDYAGLGSFLAGSDVRNIILIGAAGYRIGKEIQLVSLGKKQLFFINRFDDFAPIAFRETRPGNVCLLSPAAASYDEFQNFEERGKRFRELIQR